MLRFLILVKNTRVFIYKTFCLISSFLFMPNFGCTSHALKKKISINHLTFKTIVCIFIAISIYETRDLIFVLYLTYQSLVIKSFFRQHVNWFYTKSKCTCLLTNNHHPNTSMLLLIYFLKKDKKKIIFLRVRTPRSSTRANWRNLDFSQKIE